MALAINIRECTGSDINAIEFLQEQWHRQDSTYQPWHCEQMLKMHIGPYFLVAERDYEIIGYVIAMKNSRAEGSILEAKDLFVKKDYGNYGIGKKLINEILNQARQDGVLKCTLVPAQKGWRAIERLYKPFGFERVDISDIEKPGLMSLTICG